jgi:hypothetical protein
MGQLAAGVGALVDDAIAVVVPAVAELGTCAARSAAADGGAVVPGRAIGYATT